MPLLLVRDARKVRQTYNGRHACRPLSTEGAPWCAPALEHNLGCLISWEYLDRPEAGYHQRAEESRLE